MLNLVGRVLEALARLQSLPALQATVVFREHLLWVARSALGVVKVGVLLDELTALRAGLRIRPGVVCKPFGWLVPVVLHSELRTKLPAQRL